jgi:transcriptional regulator with XRE-family HTH domain
VFDSRTNLDLTKRKNIIGARMKEARRNYRPRLTQADLSALLKEYGCQIDRAGISKIESGARIVMDFELKAIGEALNVTVGWLVDEKPLP